MTTAFNISGSLFSREITFNEIEEIKNNIKPNEIKTLWDKIVDWFLGTDKENAKETLSTLMNSDDVNKKIEAFNQLKSMVSPAFKELFTYTIEIDDTSDTNDTSFSFVLSIGELISTEKLSTQGKTIEMEDKIKTFTERCDNQRDIKLGQLKLDIPRSNVFLFNDSKEPERITLENIDNHLVNKISEEQKKSLNVALSQTGMIDICDQIYQNAKEIPMLCSPNKTISLFLDNLNNVIINMNFFNNIDENTYVKYKEIYPDLRHRCFSANATVEIDSNGYCSITRVNVTHPGIE
ncbi:hypothetical protein [Symbiopectobacterium purcellii]|uniref:Uncharacterized protein n=1 Tax=Symbiopectobacterium purcellii TaxID=2871826 RepID=A0ABX9AQ37_9ENTR|nr:hypothetical protein [Symbiopectobacterium purcellii]QZN96141.1 hypothetical protein K6K13_01200 [Symbiopectobacterium purcellii]